VRIRAVIRGPSSGGQAQQRIIRSDHRGGDHSTWQR
jgi:hypothetical protein